MSEKILSEHVSRRAMVYVRQSTESQVRTNTESLRRQRALKGRAVALGWPAERVEVIEDDLGLSGAASSKRPGFLRVLEAVRQGEVGLILAAEASRLARNSVDWQRLMQYCGLRGVLLGDEESLYDPTNPHDAVLLGIQGTMAVYEWFMLRDRMEKGLWQKAKRGELFSSAPPGYVYLRGHGLVKHPDRRAQRAIEKLFREFETCSSVYELYRRLCAERFLLPAVPPGGDSDETVWVEPHYHRLVRMLKNPVYAGIYAFGRTRTEQEIEAHGDVHKRRRRVDPQQWEVVIEDILPAYITRQQYERNTETIAMNASQSGNRVKTAPQKGIGLAVGLMRCYRCGHKLGVRYTGKGTIRYYCRQGLPQRGETTGKCFSFIANDLEGQLVESILYAISPAGVQAAELAAQRMAEQRETVRQRLLDAVEDSRYKANLGRRRLEKVDPDRRLVFDTLTQEWELALRALKEHEAKLEAFDREQPQVPSPEQRQELMHLGEDVQRAWFHPKADMTMKKEIVRTLVKEIVVDVHQPADEVVWVVQWSGGHHTELRSLKANRPVRCTADLKKIFDTLRRVHDDDDIARILNRASFKTDRGENWTKRRIANFRNRHAIPPYCPETKQDKGWLSQQEAATYLKISPMSVHRLILKQILPAEYYPGLPSVISSPDLQRRAVQSVVRAIKSHGNSPLPKNPNQLSLFNTTTR